VDAVFETWVALLVMVTLASAITAPVASVTVPLIPLSVCPTNMEVAEISRRKSAVNDAIRVRNWLALKRRNMVILDSFKVIIRYDWVQN